MRLLLMWLILACPAWTQQEPRQGIERGRLIPKVSCLSDGKFSYALYLPKGYAADRAWPVLLAFAPDGDGAGPVMLFQAEAERLGWIVAGSLDSRNGAVEPNLAAQKALWEDLHKRFNIDSRRVVSTGFSGGARMAMRGNRIGEWTARRLECLMRGAGSHILTVRRQSTLQASSLLPPSCARGRSRRREHVDILRP